jgi:multidrug efflux pump subunit AcrA (membrane-fusion protein)
VTRIVQAADISKNTLQVKVAIADPSSELKPEMLARVRFFAATASTVSLTNKVAGQLVFAPSSLIENEHNQTYVWTVDRATETARRTPVEVGSAQHEDWVSITKGLQPGDQLIANSSNVRDGMHVRIVGEAKLNKESSHGIY